VKRRRRPTPLALFLNRLRFGLVGVILLGSGLAVVLNWPHPTVGFDSPFIPYAFRQSYWAVNRDIQHLKDDESRSSVQVVPDQELQNHLTLIQLEVSGGRLARAQQQIRVLQAALRDWHNQLDQRVSENTLSVATTATPGQQYVPILLYHYTPPDFEQQLLYLRERGYTAIDLDQAAAAIVTGATLPIKPVVITYDDGFADQIHAFDILKKYQMKATFYIINGSAESQWCLGAGRRYGDPLQPTGGCGDAYLSWDQVLMLDHSGLITIADHTFDHFNLASLSDDQQRREIIGSKRDLEQHLGHPVRHFAYPYGAYNETSIALMKEAGFVTAVTTLPGTYQDAENIYTLRRVRDAYSLP
jgi:peptidoglycan/xylan/chitin deacetylase (PgdA/CDA1 family)